MNILLSREGYLVYGFQSQLLLPPRERLVIAYRSSSHSFDPFDKGQGYVRSGQAPKREAYLKYGISYVMEHESPNEAEKAGVISKHPQLFVPQGCGDRIS